MIKQTFTQKQTGDSLSASEWNGLTGYINTAVDAINAGSASVVTVTDETELDGDPTVGVTIASGVEQVGSPKVIELTKKKKGVNTTLTSGNNINIEPRESVGETKGGNISFKPGDDIEFCSHHRLQDNQDEVSVKVIDGDDNPVKLQLNAAEMTLTTKDKTGNDANVFDINVNSGKNTKGYLKVRAQAIDLRCEDHGGIALQPKGEDGQGHLNKIKFEHGGGDGLEFGTFNAEKTSIFTPEYRFNKDGVVKLATRTIAVSDKYDNSDETTHNKYVKAADDFYDNIDQNDPTSTWKDIVKAGKDAGILDLNVENGSINIQDRLVAGHTQTPGETTVVEYSYYHDDPWYAQNNVVEIDCTASTGLILFNGEITMSDFKHILDVAGLTSSSNSIISSMAQNEDGTKFAINYGDEVFFCTLKRASDNFVISCGSDNGVQLGDIIKLVNYMKTNNEGPWASNL